VQLAVTPTSDGQKTSRRLSLFLPPDEAGWITGTTLVVEGGQRSLIPRSAEERRSYAERFIAPPSY
jgi:hypothetical protein